MVREARTLFGLRTGDAFSADQEKELMHIITKALPAGVRQFIHKEGHGTLDQLMKAVKIAQSFGPGA